MEKDKKKTLTISSGLKKKIDTSSISTDGKKSFSVKKKEPFRGNKNSNRSNQTLNQTNISISWIKQFGTSSDDLSNYLSIDSSENISRKALLRNAKG